MLFGKGSTTKEGKARISDEQFKAVLKSGGKLTLSEALRCRIRHFSDGAVLGGRAFVTKQLAHYSRLTGKHQRTSARELPALTDWGSQLATLRGLRKKAPPNDAGNPR
jgi:hypothetical protein